MQSFSYVKTLFCVILITSLLLFGLLLTGVVTKLDMRDNTTLYTKMKWIESEEDSLIEQALPGTCETIKCDNKYGLPVPVNIEAKSWSYLEEKNRLHSNVPGISWMPSNCRPKWTIAVIVPYRNRDAHLRIFLYNMVPFLQKQQAAFTIFIVEQKDKGVFNKATVMNIGYIEARKLYEFDCYIFHDVDLIPENACNLYACHPMPRHLTVAIDKFNYTLPYEELFGGAIILNSTHMSDMNGFSNSFYGWGGEDDNIYGRVILSGYNVVRYSEHIARYKMLYHKEDFANPALLDLSDEAARDIAKYKEYDGLNNMTEYKVTDITKHSFYTWIKVELPGPVGNARAYLFKDFIRMKRPTDVKLPRYKAHLRT